MKTYTILCKVTSCIGSQLWSVQAESESDAKERFRNNEAVLKSETIEAAGIEIEKVEPL